MAIRAEVRQRVEELTAELRLLLHGEGGLPPAGTKFIDMEDQAAEMGDALAQALLSASAAGRGPAVRVLPAVRASGGGRCGAGAAFAPDASRRRDVARDEAHLPPLSAGFFSLRAVSWASSRRPRSARAC